MSLPEQNWLADESSVTTRTPLADVDTSRFDLGIEKACALIDRLEREKAALLEAAQTAVSFLRCVEWENDRAADTAADIETLLEAAISQAARA